MMHEELQKMLNLTKERRKEAEPNKKMCRKEISLKRYWRQNEEEKNLLWRCLWEEVGVSNLCLSFDSSLSILSILSILSFLSILSSSPANLPGLTGKNEGLGVPELPVEPVPLPVYTSVRSSAYNPSFPIAESWRPLGMYMMTNVMEAHAIIPQAAHTS